MNLFDVYNLYDVTPVRAQGCHLWDDKNKEYLDLYGGHAVISIGHSHPKYIAAITEQLNKIGFYSNSVTNPLQQELATKLGEMSGYDDYSLFLVNSGAEANENALKLASFHTGRNRVIAFRKSFHGRTSGAVAVTDNPSIGSPYNRGHKVTFVDLGDLDLIEKELAKRSVAAVIIEGIQGCGGVHIPTDDFMRSLQRLCHTYGTMLIVDEVQSGYGRTGKFFAHQWAGIKADLVTMGKGIANGFPCAGVLISPEIEAVKGRLGTTFGGNYLAMAAAISTLDVMKEERLIDNARRVGDWLKEHIPSSPRIKTVRGRGLMIGIEFREPVAPIRKKLLYDKRIFTGVAGMNIIRLLPPLCLSQDEAVHFVSEFRQVIQ